MSSRMHDKSCTLERCSWVSVNDAIALLLMIENIRTKYDVRGFMGSLSYFFFFPTAKLDESLFDCGLHSFNLALQLTVSACDN